MLLQNIIHENSKVNFQRGVIAAIPVMIGFIPFALVLGNQAVQKELSPLSVFLMTALNFGGGSEFAAIELWSSPPNIILIVSITLLVNSRHVLMGATLVPLTKHLPNSKVLPALFFMCDESWAMGLADTKQRSNEEATAKFSLSYYFGVSICLYLTWITFTTVGAFVGPMINNIESYGLDMAFPAVFLILLTGMWNGVQSIFPWLLSLLIAILTYLFIPGGWYVVTGTLSGLLVAFLWGNTK